MLLHQTQSRVDERIIAQERESARRPLCYQSQAIGGVRPGDRIEQQRRVGHGARQRAMRVEERPGGDHTGARHQSERGLHSDDAAELRRNTIGTPVVGTERGEGHATRDGDGRACTRATGCSRSGWVVRVAHLPGERAGAVATIRKIVGDRLAEYDGACCAHTGHFDRIASNRQREQSGPLGARRRCGETIHIVDRLGKDRDAVERAA